MRYFLGVITPDWPKIGYSPKSTLDSVPTRPTVGEIDKNHQQQH